MPSFLSDIYTHKQAEVEALKQRVNPSKLEREIFAAKGLFKQALQGNELKIIAEIKPASPSAGLLNSSQDFSEIVAAYDRHARAISVLTDTKYFAGSYELLAEISKMSQLPTLCKDFIIDPFQVFAARRAGAEAVLLIVKLLSDVMVSELVGIIRYLGMSAVVEVQNEDELNRALKISPDALLINNRNLDTLEIDLSTTLKLAPLIPSGIVAVSASGIECARDLRLLRPYCSTFLIGSALMKSTDVEATLQGLISL